MTIFTKKAFPSWVAMLAVFALGMTYIPLPEAAHAKGADFSMEHANFTVSTTAIEIKTDSGKAIEHYSCQIEDGETETVYIGDSTVSSTDFGAAYKVSDGAWGAPHGDEYMVLASGSAEVHCRFSVSDSIW